MNCDDRIFQLLLWKRRGSGVIGDGGPRVASPAAKGTKPEQDPAPVNPDVPDPELRLKTAILATATRPSMVGGRHGPCGHPAQ